MSPSASSAPRAGKPPGQEELERLAGALSCAEGLVEKDWHVVRALAALAGIEHEGIRLCFGGGTSLSRAYGLIARFSEDIDFKVLFDGDDLTRAKRRSFRAAVLDRMAQAGFAVQGEPIVWNESRFFQASFDYSRTAAPVDGLRPHLKLEVTLVRPALPPVARKVRSFVSRARKASAEVPSIACVNPIETAAEKLSALTWRVIARDRAAEDDDPSIVRHIHDLAALEALISGSGEFARLARATVDADAARDSAQKELDADTRLARMISMLHDDPGYATEYDRFVHSASYAEDPRPAEFPAALAVCKRLVERMRDARSR